MHQPRFHRLIIMAPLSCLAAGHAMAGPPDVSLERLDGKQQAMSDHIGNGQWVVVNIWSPTCSSCVEELPDVIQFHENHPDIPVLGVTIDFPSFEYGKPEIIKGFLEKQPLDYPLFLAGRELASELIGRKLIAIPLIAIFHPGGHAVTRWQGRINPGEIDEFINNYDSYKLDDSELGGF